MGSVKQESNTSPHLAHVRCCGSMHSCRKPRRRRNLRTSSSQAEYRNILSHSYPSHTTKIPYVDDDGKNDDTVLAHFLVSLKFCDTGRVVIVLHDTSPMSGTPRIIRYFIMKSLSLSLLLVCSNNNGANYGAMAFTTMLPQSKFGGQTLVKTTTTPAHASRSPWLPTPITMSMGGGRPRKRDM